MEPLASSSFPEREPGWRRFVVGLVLRSLRTLVGYALGGLALFLVVVLVADRTLVDDPAVPFGLLAFLYVLLGVLAGANLGVATALRRETVALVERSGWIVRPVVERTLTRLAVPKEGVATERLRELAELPFVAARHTGLARVLASFAVRRALEDAGLQALQERLLGLVEQAESLGHPTVGRELVEAAARDGLTAAVVRQLDVGWRTNRAFALAYGAVALASLPVLAVVWL